MSSPPTTLGDYLPSAPKHWRRLLVAALLLVAARKLQVRLRARSLRGEVVVVTGAGSGIGRLMSLRLAREGCRLALWDLNEETARKTAAEASALGAEVKAYSCDVSDREAVYAAGRTVLQDFGRVDILINNAGIVSGKKLLEASDALMEKTIAVNTTALLWCTKAFLPGMLERNKGHVVTIASCAGRVGTPGLVDYCASKFGAVGFDESLRQELTSLGSKVRTTVICPFYIATGMFQGARMQPPIRALTGIVNMLMPVLEPEYVAKRVVLAIKRDEAQVVMPRFAYLSTLVRALTSPRLGDWINMQLGSADSMKDFKATRKVQV